MEEGLPRSGGLTQGPAVSPATTPKPLAAAVPPVQSCRGRGATCVTGERCRFTAPAGGGRGELFHSFPETGLTCVLILSESHAVLHTWPETGTVNIDIFSCSTRLRSLEAIDELRRSFGAQHVTVQEIPRADGHGPLPDGRS